MMETKSIDTRKKLLLLLLTCLTSIGAAAQNINVTNRTGPLGAQVNTLTGNLFLSRNDMYIPDRIAGLDISFFYNSFNFPQQSGFGNGWTFIYAVKYLQDSAGDIIITWGDGRSDLYRRTGSGTYTTPVGFTDTLSSPQTGQFLLQTKYGTQFYFNNSTTRRLTKIQDPRGNNVSLTYTDTLLTGIANGAGQTISLTYNAGLLSTVTDANATPTRTYSYQYDAGGNLIQVTDPLGKTQRYKYLVNGPLSEMFDKNANTADIIYFPDYTVSEVIGCNSRESFSYDTASHKTAVTDYLTTGSNQVTTYQYQVAGNGQEWLTHVSGNCCGFNMSYAFDASGNMIQSTDANGNNTRYTYDNKSNILSITDPLGHVSAFAYTPDFNQVKSYTDRNGSQYTQTYDNKGNPLAFNMPGGIVYTSTWSSLGDETSLTDGRGNMYNYTYDTYGNLTKQTNPLSASKSFTYDARGNLLSETDETGNTYSAKYDILGRPLSINTPASHSLSLTYDANDNPTTFTDLNGHTSRIAYDASNRVVGYTDANGNQALYTYDAKNNLIQIQDPSGKITSLVYDNLNRLSSVSDALGNAYSYQYDYNGNRIGESFPGGETKAFNFDALNRITSESDGTGAMGNVTYDNNGRITSYTNGTGATLSAFYDPLGRLTQLTDPLGNTKKWTYDGNGNLIAEVDRDQGTSTYAYDGANRNVSYTDQNGQVTTTAYDAANNIAKVTDAAGHTTTFTYDAMQRPSTTTYADGKIIQYGYDNAYNVLSKKLADGTQIQFQYDAMNRLISKTIPGTTAFTYGYDVNGRMISAANSNGTISITYDNISRVTSESFNGHTTSYTYNDAARSLIIAYPDSSTVQQNFDTRNRLVSILKGSVPLVTYQYNNANQRQQATYANGLSTVWTYDQANRLNNLTTAASNIQNSTFSYDGELNKTAVTGTAAGLFTYDPAHRLTRYSRGSSIQNMYTYDAAGNRTGVQSNGVSNAYSVNALNQYVKVGGSAAPAWTYDNNGNVTYDGSFYKTYDAEGRLLADSNASTKVWYQYDALGRRIEKITGGNAIGYYYAGLNAIETRNAVEDTVLTQTVFGGYAHPVQLTRGDSIYYYHLDDQQSVSAISNANGGLVERYQYDAFGQPLLTDSLNNVLGHSLIGNRYAFTGQEYDAETGTYHFFYRNYNPVTGRFEQRDPLQYGDGLNMYQYVHNNPGTLTDPLGLSPCPPPPPPPPSFFNPDNNPSGDFGQVTGAISTSTGILSITSLPQGLSKLAIHSPLVGVALLPVNAAATVTASQDLGASWDQNSTGQKIDGTLNLVAGGTGVAATSYVMTNTAVYTTLYVGAGATMENAALFSATVFTGAAASPGVIVAGGGAAIYGTTSWTYKTAVDHPGVADFLGRNNGNMEAYEQYIQDYEYHTKIGNLQQWLAALRKTRHKPGNALNYVPPPSPMPSPGGDDCPPNGTTGGTQQNASQLGSYLGQLVYTTVIEADDPNEIIGPVGVGKPAFVSINNPMPYTILFANSNAASAPAKAVRINYPIDPKQDVDGFSLGTFGFNSETFTVPPNTSSYTQRLDLRDSLGLFVDVTAGLDVIGHQVFWTFQSIDPVTLLPPADPLKGFLLLSDSSKPTSGRGFVNFTMKPLATDKTGDTTSATAAIIFDANNTIPTNIAVNTIDAVAPTTQIDTLAAATHSSLIPLSWKSKDDPHGSGVLSYTLYMAADGGSYGVVQSGMTRTDTTIKGTNGSVYSFFVLATDSTGNMETLRPNDTTATLVDTTALPTTWLSFTAVLQGSDGLLKWSTGSEKNSSRFIIERSTDGQHFTSIDSVAAAGFSSVQKDYTYLDKNIVALKVPTVYYKLDLVGTDSTNIYSNIVSVTLPDTSTGTGGTGGTGGSGASGTPVITPYPNPFHQTINVLIAQMPTVSADDNVTLYTVDGKRVYTKNIGQRTANTTVTLTNLPALLPGVYIMELQLNKQLYTFKMLKQ